MAHLGIDLGTSAVKLCITDASGAVVALAEAPLTSQHPFPGASEQDPDAWIAALTTAMTALPEERRAQIAVIGLSGQMHGAVLLDETHQPLHPAILWNDGRAGAECADIAAAVPDIGHITGVPPMPGFTAPKLLWLSRHAPDIHAQIAHVLLPKDYVGLYLHGSLATDPSDAAGTSWFDQHTGQWSQALCDASATDIGWLPQVLPGVAIAGSLTAPAARALGLPPGIPVATGAGDAAAGAMGIGAISPGDGFLSLGTSGQMFVTTSACHPNPDSRTHSYAHTLPNLWFNMAAMLNGARPMAWLSELLDRPIADLITEAEATPPDTGPLFLPYLSGERTPHGDNAIRAGFWGLSETTSQGAMMRAVMEAIAFTFADAQAAMATGGARPKTLLAIGGGTRSDALLQMIADAMQVPLGRSDAAEVGPALGAARLGQIALGGRAQDVATKPEISRWFTPDPARVEAIAPRLAGYRALYPALKSVNAAIG